MLGLVSTSHFLSDMKSILQCLTYIYVPALYFKEHYITLLKTKIDNDEYRYRLIETLPQDDVDGNGFIDECRDIECLHSLLLAYAYKRLRNGDENVELDSSCNLYTGYIFTRKEDVDDEGNNVKVDMSSPGAFAAAQCGDLNCQKDHHNVRIDQRRDNSESESDDGRFSDADWERQVQEELSDEEPSQTTQLNDVPCLPPLPSVEPCLPPEESEPSPSRQQKQDSSPERDADTSEPTSSVAVPQLTDLYNSMQSNMEAHRLRLVSIRSNARTKMKDQIKYENDQVRMAYYQLQSGMSSNGGRKKKLCTHEEGCTNIARSKGLCARHGGRKKKLCTHEEGCTNIAQSKGGLCTRHSGRRRLCEFEGCTKQAVKNRKCMRHDSDKKKKKKKASPKKKKKVSSFCAAESYILIYNTLSLN